MSKKSKKSNVESTELENKEDKALEESTVDTQETDIEEIKEEKKEESKEIEASEEQSLESNIPIREQITQKSKKELEIEQKQALKNQKKEDKKNAKFVKKHRKELKKNPGTLLRYDTDPEKGLTQDIVEKRELDDLVNDSRIKTSKSVGRIIVGNLITFFNILTFVIAGFLISVKAFTDLTFLLIVLINIGIGTFQEIRAKKTIDRLSLISAPTAVVKRDGVKHEIPVTQVVLDDLILLETGKQICADSIVLEGTIEVNESLLTGESDAIVKKPGDILYSGSFVVSGSCSARVDKVGKDNYIEKLTNQAKQYKKPKSDLMVSLSLIIKSMAVIIVPIGLTLFYIMYQRTGLPYVYSLRKTAGAMIGMIPSGLFLMTSIALAVGVIRLASRNVLVQELYCIEMLARVNCICLDKTGTITDGTMSVKNVIDYNTFYGLANNNVVSAMLNSLGDSNLTSMALIEKFGLAKRIKHTAKIPFSSARKYQAVTFEKYGTFILGAPEFVFKEKYNLIKNDVNKYAALGYRVLILAHRDGIIENGELPKAECEVASMILIEDNIRPDAINTIKYFKESGVEVKVISGDNPLTVSKISQRAGIAGAEEYVSLDGMNENEVRAMALKYTVFGRVSPAQKKILVETLKENGKTVAMTGDGVNDILALREADCSIAVASGSEAARNVSHLVLLDSNFDSMPKVVSEGRRVINNVTSVASLFLTKTIFSLLLAIQALITGTYPISTNQLFLIDVLAIGIPSLVLVLEPNNNAVQGKFLYNVIKKALPGAITILIISMIVFGLSDSLSLDSTSLSTIIVIAATHTCLMVLFKACKPFNTVRKFLCGGCYTVFLFAIFILPQIFEFRPLANFSEYYSTSLNSSSIANYPSVSISQDNYYVIDGKVTSYLKTSSSTSDYFTSKYNATEGKYYYCINNNITTTKEVTNPAISYDYFGYIYLGGYKISNYKYSNLFKYDTVNEKFVINANVRLDENGLVYYYDASTNRSDPIKIVLPADRKNTYYNHSIDYGRALETEVQLKIMPKVEISSGTITIDSVSSIEATNLSNVKVTARFHCDDLPSSTANASIKIDPESLRLLINGKPVYYQVDNVTYYYTVALPNFTTNGSLTKFDDSDTAYVSAINSKFTLYELYGEKLSDTEYKLYCTDGTEIVYNTKTDSTLATDTNGNKESNYLLRNIHEGLTSYGASPSTNTDVSTLAAIPGTTNYLLTTNNTKFFPDSTVANETRDGVSINDASICPKLELTEKGRYIINSYYTEYNVGQDDLDPRLNSENYLVLGGVETDYKLAKDDIITNTSGIVKVMSIKGLVFLLMLCLMSAPLMKLLQGLVPWLRKQINVVQKVLTKM